MNIVLSDPTAYWYSVRTNNKRWDSFLGKYVDRCLSVNVNDRKNMHFNNFAPTWRVCCFDSKSK